MVECPPVKRSVLGSSPSGGACYFEPKIGSNFLYLILDKRTFSIILIMWTCPKCQRIFGKAKQPHSCKKISLEEHFKNKEVAKKIFDYLVKIIEREIGECRIISIPCCVHLFGKYDFLAALPKKNKLEIRFSLNRVLDSPRLKQSIPISSKYYKNCTDLNSNNEIDRELIWWLNEAYKLKDKEK